MPTVFELKARCKSLGIRGYSSLRKNELMKLCMSGQKCSPKRSRRSRKKKSKITPPKLLFFLERKIEQKIDQKTTRKETLNIISTALKQYYDKTGATDAQLAEALNKWLDNPKLQNVNMLPNVKTVRKMLEN